MRTNMHQVDTDKRREGGKEGEREQRKTDGRKGLHLSLLKSNAGLYPPSKLHIAGAVESPAVWWRLTGNALTPDSTADALSNSACVLAITSPKAA